MAVIQGPEELRGGKLGRSGWEMGVCQLGGSCSKQRLGGARRTWQPASTLICQQASQLFVLGLRTNTWVLSQECVPVSISVPVTLCRLCNYVCVCAKSFALSLVEQYRYHMWKEGGILYRNLNRAVQGIHSPRLTPAGPDYRHHCLSNSIQCCIQSGYLFLKIALNVCICYFQYMTRFFPGSGMAENII